MSGPGGPLVELTQTSKGKALCASTNLKMGTLAFLEQRSTKRQKARCCPAEMPADRLPVGQLARHQLPCFPLLPLVVGIVV